MTPEELVKELRTVHKNYMSEGAPVLVRTSSIGEMTKAAADAIDNLLAQTKALEPYKTVPVQLPHTVYIGKPMIIVYNGVSRQGEPAKLEGQYVCLEDLKKDIIKTVKNDLRHEFERKGK